MPPGCGTSLGGAEPPLSLQDYIFYLEPERLESGKGKCPYDPKLDTASALISECPAALRPQPDPVGGVVPTLTMAETMHRPLGPPGRGGVCGLRGRD